MFILIGMVFSFHIGLTYGSRHCPALSINFKDFGIDDCEPSFSIKSEEELSEILNEAKCMGWKEWILPPDRGCSNPDKPPEGLTVKFPCFCDFGGKCSVSCNDGYEMIGSDEIVCQENGKWSSYPVCRLLKCDNPNLPDNMKFADTCTFTEGSSCDVSCTSPEYKVIGSKHIMCINEAWSTLPKCELFCPSEKIPDYLITPAACQGTQGTFCAVQCKNPNMTLHGEKDIKCLPNGNWEPFPICGCPHPLSRKVNKYYKYVMGRDCKVAAGGRCIAECSSRFSAEGTNRYMNCNENGRWNFRTSLKCVRICGYPKLPKTVTLAKPCSRRQGVNCEGKCVKADQKLVGPKTFHCLENGGFSKYPHCVTTNKCASNAFSDTTQIVGECRYNIGETCTLACKDTSLEFVGDTKVTCLAKGQTWSHIPECERICEMPNHPKDLVKDCNLREGQNCTVLCPQQQEPSDPVTITCMPDGTWSGFPNCVKVCPPLSPPVLTLEMLALPCSSREIGTTCKVRCRDERNYVIINAETGTESGEIKCDSSQEWKPKLKCAYKCQPPHLNKDILEVTPGCTFLEEKPCTLRCARSNYKLIGSPALKCTKGGEMEYNKLTTCAVPCLSPKFQASRGIKLAPLGEQDARCNFHEGTANCKVICQDPQATMEGSNYANCLSGSWEIEAKCEVKCPPILETALGTRIVGLCHNKKGSKCKVQCIEKGATMNGEKEQEIVCGNGQWSKTSDCEVLCGEPVLPSHLELDHPCSRKIGHSCRVMCKKQHATLEGNPLIYCRTSKWEATFPTCVERCEIPAFDGGMDFAVRCPRIVGQSCAVKCPAGISVIGHAIITCLPTLNWSPIPKCVRLCPPLPPHLRFVGTCDRASSLTHCTIECVDSDEAVDGINRIRCSSGYWLDAIASCATKLTCRPPPGMKFVEKRCQANTECRVECSNYEHYFKDNTQPYMTCDKKGVLQYDKDAGCEAIDEIETCDDGLIKSPLALSSYPPFITGRKYFVNCPNSYTLVGSKQILCEPTGRWSTLPECRKKCQQAELIARRLIIIPEHCKGYANTYCGVRCHSGYYIERDVMTFCNDRGMWSTNGMPTCTQEEFSIHVCPPLPLHFNPVLSNKDYDKNIHEVECKNRSTVIYGPHLIKCTKDGTYSEMPKCHPKDPEKVCPYPILPSHMKLITCLNPVGYPIQHSCTVRLECPAEKEVFIFCLSTLEWSKAFCEENLSVSFTS